MFDQVQIVIPCIFTENLLTDLDTLLITYFWFTDTQCFRQLSLVSLRVSPTGYLPICVGYYLNVLS